MKSYGRVNLPFTGIASFCKFPIHTDLETLSADVAIFGVPWDEGVGYRPGAVGLTQSAAVMIILEFLGTIFRQKG